MPRLLGTASAIGVLMIAALFAPVSAAGGATPNVEGDFGTLTAHANTASGARAIVELNANPSDATDIRAKADSVQREVGAAGTVTRTMQSTNLAAVKLSPQGVQALRRSPNVRRVYTDDLLAPKLDQSTQVVGAPTAWANGSDGAGQVVAVIDTGVDANHPFLKNKVVEEMCFATGYSATGGCPNRALVQAGAGAAQPCAASGCEHGTHVAGIIAGKSSGKGAPVGGVARGATVLAIQVFSVFPAGSADCRAACPRAWTSDIIAALDYVRARKLAGLRVASANLSLGGGLSKTVCASTPYEAPFAALRAVGVAPVVAAGNDGVSDSLEFPACAPSAISVGATNKADQIDDSYSNTAPFLKFLAPGTNIRSSVPGGKYATMTGTSMATPHVAAAFALMRQRYGDTVTLNWLQDRLTKTAKKIVDPRNGRSFARINLAAALPVDPAVKPKR